MRGAQKKTRPGLFRPSPRTASSLVTAPLSLLTESCFRTGPSARTSAGTGRPRRRRRRARRHLPRAAPSSSCHPLPPRRRQRPDRRWRWAGRAWDEASAGPWWCARGAAPRVPGERRARAAEKTSATPNGLSVLALFSRSRTRFIFLLRPFPPLLAPFPHHTMRASTPRPATPRVTRSVALPARVGGAAGRPVPAPAPASLRPRTIGDRCALRPGEREKHMAACIPRPLHPRRPSETTSAVQG